MKILYLGNVWAMVSKLWTVVSKVWAMVNKVWIYLGDVPKSMSSVVQQDKNCGK